jgi:hypothetical protein
MFGIKLLGSGSKFFKTRQREVEAVRAAGLPELATPKMDNTPPAAVPPASRKPWRFHNISKANEEILRLEGELARGGRSVPSPAPSVTKPATASTTPMPTKPITTVLQSPLPTWAQCSKDLRCTTAQLSACLRARSGCDFGAEVIEATGLNHATPDAQVGALLTACWLAGDSDATSKPSASVPADTAKLHKKIARFVGMNFRDDSSDAEIFSALEKFCYQAHVTFPGMRADSAIAASGVWRKAEVRGRDRFLKSSLQAGINKIIEGKQP